jgi:3-methyladenine DNA glycosylase/8-oxoguanine DNA glycosylase
VPTTPTRDDGASRVLRSFRAGRGDPTTVLDETGFWRATFTPDGPGTLQLRASGGGPTWEARSWGPGGDWLLGRVPALTGELDTIPTIEAHHPAVAEAMRQHPMPRLGASGTLYHELLPTILAQRITAGEALRQWARLVEALGEPAPGPRPDLRLPPDPERLARQPSWWFHPLGIERARVVPLVEVARHASRLWEWGRLDGETCAERLHLLRGVGPWTSGIARSLALGDPDAVAVGDFHIKHTVCCALAGSARGTDEQMLELLRPYAGQRGRIVTLLQRAGWHAPAFGPRQRVLPMSRW